MPALIIATRQSTSSAGNVVTRRWSSAGGATMCSGCMPSTLMKVCIVL